MAVMKKKGSKGLPPISTASLPDVIFLILFFFFVLILGIITGEVFHHAIPLESEHLVHHFIREETVVGYNDQTALERFQIIFQHV